MKTDTKTIYEVPEVEVDELTTEGIICQSGGTAGGGGEVPDGD